MISVEKYQLKTIKKVLIHHLCSELVMIVLLCYVVKNNKQKTCDYKMKNAVIKC